VTEEWIRHLLEVKPVNITVHGRTLEQLYSGLADWEEIGKAVAVARGSGTTILGNGDVKSRKEALEKVSTYGVDGILIGRAANGNPWVFTGTVADYPVRLSTALEHCRAFSHLTPDAHFLALRKHLAWYCRGFEGAAEVRSRLVQINTLEDVENIISGLGGSDKGVV
jgi:tRNA-dihydrouridine synthase